MLQINVSQKLQVCDLFTSEFSSDRSILISDYIGMSTTTYIIYNVITDSDQSLFQLDHLVRNITSVNLKKYFLKGPMANIKTNLVVTQYFTGDKSPSIMNYFRNKTKWYFDLNDLIERYTLIRIYT